MKNFQLNERLQNILIYVINEFIKTGQPVGSRTISKKYKLNLSPATIRNIMADLEEMGLLTQPHTSAGRIPTKEGLKYYVDNLMGFSYIPELIKNQIDSFIKNKEQNFENFFNDLSDLLSNLTNSIGVVVYPDLKKLKLKHIEFVKLNDTQILVVLVNELGHVENRIIEIEKNSISQMQLDKLSNFLNQKYSGKDLMEIKNEIINELKFLKSNFNAKISEIIDKFTKINWEEKTNKEVIVKGLNKIVDSEVLKSDFNQLKNFIKLFEEKSKLLEILEKTYKSPGIQIFIGNAIPYLEDMSIITSTYSKGDTILGSLGIIGPLRMNYQTIIPLVEYTSKLISSLLEKQN